ncbi:hypothetical protein FTV88_0969 [Heliorestis convoluta]|uniref:Uncharacterized protein n=1 Tax=Heliorestis convoluta TaxID=356322 RepID=A0A5Q2MYR2_9FIRM|nr:hypothetical protein FTV88_0969 [Heliorestis convoluta]
MAYCKYKNNKQLRIHRRKLRKAMSTESNNQQKVLWVWSSRFP